MTRSLPLSAFLHLSLIGVIIWLAWPKPSPQFGWHTPMTASLISNSSSHAQSRENSHKKIAIHSKQSITKVKQQLAPHKPLSIQTQKLSGQVAKVNSHLLIVLHNKIQAKVNESNYLIPDFLKGRTAEVQFELTPEKIIQSINLIKSSGSKQLDNLAISAVQQVKPPSIKQDKTFRVNLLFN